MSKEGIRTCPDCGKEIIYHSSSAGNIGLKYNHSCRSCGVGKTRNRNSKLDVLLEDTGESFYGIGFLLADGSFHNNRISLQLSIKDFDHVKRFGNFIQYSGSYGFNKTHCGIHSKNIEIVSNICRKFDIKSRKTYNPPETLLKFDNDLLLALIVGFIDGDGCIQNGSSQNGNNIHIKVYKSWLSILKEFSKILNLKNTPKLINEDYALLIISDSTVIRNLKNFAIEHNLPILIRKWDKVNLDTISTRERARKLRIKVLQLYNEQGSRKAIAFNCDTSYQNVCKIIRKYKNK